MRRENHLVQLSKYETSDVYDRDRAAMALPLRRAAAKELAPRLAGSVLLAGWSAELQFTPPSAERIVVADVSPKVLKSVPKRNNVSVVCAEAGRLPFDLGTFDVVLAADILHHLAEDNSRETDMALREFIKNASNVLKREGTLLIFEPLVNVFLETLNRALFLPARVVMNARGVPVPCYYSLASLKEIVFDSGMVLASARRVPVPGDFMLTARYPDYTIPYSLLPVRFYLLECRKKI